MAFGWRADGGPLRIMIWIPSPTLKTMMTEKKVNLEFGTPA